MDEFDFVGEMDSCTSALSLIYELTYEETDKSRRYDLSVAENAIISRMERAIEEQYQKIFAERKKEMKKA